MFLNIGNFNLKFLIKEQNIYETEGLGLRKINYIDNQDCIGKNNLL